MPSPTSALNHLIDVLGLEDTRDLVRIYLDQTAKELARLRQLPVNKQVIVVHGLKGSSSQVGAMLFAAQCGALETQLKHSSVPLNEDELRALTAGFNECAAPFQTWLGQPVTPL
ncbi:MAG TPA: Hpt domain-containing protein [Opitutaceae bacterium]|jgi:HPt (histidine-containing phosphotransfer) domain-containing protein|nr:Hpt domain-containing protein [Opitutaceae bacterium]